MRKAFLLATVTLLALSAGTPAFALPKDAWSNVKESDANADTAPVEDPWTGFNKPVFKFNLGFDRYVMKPVVSVYDVIPADPRHNVSNFLGNLYEPLNAVHGILQLNPQIFFTSLWRFVLNTTFGLGGLRDFAREQAGLPVMHQNLGITMGRWGMHAGPYVVLPILGPSSARDTVGKVGDWFLDPVSWVINTPETIAEEVMDGVDTRDTKQKVIEHLYYQSLDPYAATRSAYRQHEAFEASKRQ